MPVRVESSVRGWPKITAYQVFSSVRLRGQQFCSAITHKAFVVPGSAAFHPGEFFIGQKGDAFVIQIGSGLTEIILR